MCMQTMPCTLHVSPLTYQLLHPALTLHKDSFQYVTTAVLKEVCQHGMCTAGCE